MGKGIRDFLHMAIADSGLDDREISRLSGLESSTVWRIRNNKSTPRWATVKKILAAIGFELRHVAEIRKKYFPDEVISMSDHLDGEGNYNEPVMAEIAESVNLVKIYAALGKKDGTSFAELKKILGDDIVSMLIDYLLTKGVIDQADNGRITGQELTTENVLTILKFVVSIAKIAKIAKENVIRNPDSTRALNGCWGVSDWADSEIRSVVTKTCDKIFEIYRDPRARGNRTINIGIVVTD